MLWALLVLGFAPALFWLIYFYRKDRYQPEPARLVIRCFSFGLLVTFPAALVEMPFGPFVSVVLVAPVVEELAKYLVVRKGVYSASEFDEPMDGIVYAAAAALGFASLENVLYFHQSLQDDSLAAVFILRSMLSTPGHVLWSSVWGAALGLAKFMDPADGRILVGRALVSAMLLHALFNAICFTFGTAGFLFGAIGMTVLTLFLWKGMKRRLRAAEDASPFAPPPADPR